MSCSYARIRYQIHPVCLLISKIGTDSLQQFWPQISTFVYCVLVLISASNLFLGTYSLNLPDVSGSFPPRQQTQNPSSFSIRRSGPSCIILIVFISSLCIYLEFFGLGLPETGISLVLSAVSVTRVFLSIRRITEKKDEKATP